MKRQLLAASGIALAGTFGLGAMANSASASELAGHQVKVGSEWTFALKGLGCENVKFTTNGRFVALHGAFGGDAGTYKGGSSTITMTWTRGGDSGAVYTGTHYKKGYSGTVVEGGNYAATLTPGTTPTC